jgi:hypothetical protein
VGSGQWALALAVYLAGLSERATQLIMTRTADHCQTADRRIKIQDNNTACQNTSAKMAAEA